MAKIKLIEFYRLFYRLKNCNKVCKVDCTSLEQLANYRKKVDIIELNCVTLYH